MKTITLYILMSLATLSGCSSESSNSSNEASDSLGADHIDSINYRYKASDSREAALTLRLTSVHKDFSSKFSAVTTYEYDERGNLKREVNSETVRIYNIEPDGRFIDSVLVRGATRQGTIQYHYHESAGLRRIDNMATLANYDALSVTSFKVFNFENGLVTSSETRLIPFKDISENGQINDSAGKLGRLTKYKYDGDRLMKVLLDGDKTGGDKINQIEYTYNENGTLARTVMRTRIGVITSVYSYEQGACNHNWGNSTDRYFCVAVDNL